MGERISIPEYEKTEKGYEKIRKRIKLLYEIINMQEKLLVCYRLGKTGEYVGNIIDKLGELKEKLKRNE